MTPSSTSTAVAASPSGVPRFVWMLVGLMAAAITVLAGAMAWKTVRPEAPQAMPETAAAPTATAPEMMAAASAPMTAAAPTPATALATPADEVTPPPKAQAQPEPAPAHPAPAKHRHTAPTPAATAPAAQAGEDRAPESRTVAAAQPAPVCSTCGTIESVEAVQKKGEGSGLGVVAGGVLGGVVGHQIGGGHGKDLTTVLGAIGGGLAGNEIEKRTKSTTSYNVRVRMEDGSMRTVNQQTAPTVGQRVTVEGNTIRANNSSGPSSSATEAPARTWQTSAPPRS